MFARPPLFCLILLPSFVLSSIIARAIQPTKAECDLALAQIRLELEIVERSGVLVNENGAATENQTAINCHGYSCRRSGLQDTPNWIEDNRQFKRLLREHFKRIKRYPDADIGMLETAVGLREGDLVAFVEIDPWSGDDGRPAVKLYIHSGLLVLRESHEGPRFWIRSKIGKLSTVDLAPVQLSSMYGSRHKTIEVWRRNP